MQIDFIMMISPIFVCEKTKCKELCGLVFMEELMLKFSTVGVVCGEGHTYVRMWYS